MISEIRSFIRARVQAVDTDLKEWKDAFEFNNIPDSIVNDRYHISFELPTEVISANCYTEETASAELKLFKKAPKESTSAYDSLMDKAHSIKLKTINPNLVPSGGIKYATVTSIIAEPLGNNDNLIVVTLTFSFKLIFSAT